MSYSDSSGHDSAADELSIDSLEAVTHDLLVRDKGLTGDGKSEAFRFWAFVAFCLVTFVGIRIPILQANVLFTDHDSVSFLTSINTIAGHTPADLEYRSADFLPLFPYWAALVSRVSGMSAEHSAQTVSLIMTSLSLVAVLSLVRLHFSNCVVLITGLLISFCPKLAQLDTAMLTDPMYVSIVYIALFVYERRPAARASWRQAVLLGLLLGLGFLTRSEGILWVAVLPAWHLLSLWWNEDLRFEWLNGIAWSAIFLVVFGAVISFHVWSVSQKMGKVALNGRQAWLALLNEPTEAEYEEKLRGLRFSSTEINLTYLMSHPEAADELAKPASAVIPHVKNTLYSVTQLFDFPIHMLPGPMNMLFGGVGLLIVMGMARFQRFGLFVALCLALLVPGIVYAAFSVRYLLISMPGIMICSAVGLVTLCGVLADTLLRFVPALPRRLALLTAGVMLTFASGAFPLYNMIAQPDTEHLHYSMARLQVLADAIEPHRPADRHPLTVSRTAYFPYFARTKQIANPWASYEELVDYCRQNNADFFLYQASSDRTFPYAAAFEQGDPADFELLTETGSSFGKEAIYRVRGVRDSTGAP